MRVKIILILALALSLFAQSDVEFHGTNRAMLQYSTRQGTDSEIPEELWRNDLTLKLILFGVPIEGNTFFSAEENIDRQPLNQFRLRIDFREMARLMAQRYAPLPGMPNAPRFDPSIERPEAPGFIKFLSNFSAMEIGRCRPDYGRLSLRGIALTGGNVTYESKIFYAAFAMGEVKRAIEPENGIEPTYSRDLLFVKGGIGRDDETHFHFAYMKSGDDENSLDSTDRADSLYIFPQENTVVSTDVLLQFGEPFTLKGEAAYSLHTRRKDAMTFDSELPPTVQDLATVNISSSADYAYVIESELKLKTTRITGGFDYIGSGFHNFGNPNLITDRMAYHGKVNQNFLRHKIPVSVYFKRTQDNLADWKIETTNTLSYGITAGLRFPNVPYLQVSYMPNSQSYEDSISTMNSQSNIINGLLGYSYRLGDLSLSSNLNYYYQHSTSELDTADNVSTTNTATFSQTLAFGFPLDLSGTYSLSRNEYLDDTEDITTISGDISYTAFESWRNTVGASLTQSPDREKRTGLYLRSSVALWGFGDLSLKLEQNIFDDLRETRNSYDELLGRVDLTVRW